MAAQEISENDLQVAIDKAVTKALHAHTPQVGVSTNTSESIPSSPKPQEAHPIYDFMQSCPNCGQTNTEYKPTKYRCSTCKVPVVPDRTDKCWNCGNKEAELNEQEESEE